MADFVPLKIQKCLREKKMKIKLSENENIFIFSPQKNVKYKKINLENFFESYLDKNCENFPLEITDVTYINYIVIN